MNTLPTHVLVPCLFLALILGGATRSRCADAPAESPSVLPEGYSCNVCHKRDGDLWDDQTPIVEEKDLVDDIHWQRGLRCHDCHGGSATMDDFKNHRDDPAFHTFESRADIPGFCGRCHSSIEIMRQFNPSARTDQEAEYRTSGHGRHLQATAEAGLPDPVVATCVDCHGRHGSLVVEGGTTADPAAPAAPPPPDGIRAVKDTNSSVYPTRVAATCARCHSDENLMAGRTYRDRPLRHDQFAQWQDSVHGRALLEKGDLAAPACNDCHGNHGAMPPGVESVANACGTCHGKIAKLFSETRMKHRFEEAGLPGCAACHGNHLIGHPSDEMLGMEDVAVCSKCHNPQSPQYGATVAGAQTAKTMRDRLEKLKREIADAERKIREAERLGMEVGGPRFDLRQAVDSLTNARTLVHSFQLEPLDEALNEGLAVTANVKELADDALRDYTHRRIWLAASLVPILLVVGVLLLYIRSLPIPAGDASRRAPDGDTAS